MNFLNLDPAELQQRGANHTAQEIAQQPYVWASVHQLVSAEAERLKRFLRPLIESANLRIVFTGAGSSAYIGQCLAPLLLKALSDKPGIRVEAVATTDIVSSPAQCLQAEVPTLLVSFGRSGNSPESLAAIELADRFIHRCHHLVVTCAEEGLLNLRLRNHPQAQVLLLPDATHDRAFAMTSSFTGMLLATAWALGLELPPVEQLAGAASTLLARESKRLRAVAERPVERVVYLGSNALLGLAREAALKMLELSDGRVIAIADSSLGFRHGPKTILNAQTLVVVILSNDPYTRRYDLDLVEELRREGCARVLVLRTGQGSQDGDDSDVPIDLPAYGGDLALAAVALVFAQSLALLKSLELGITPDNPSVSGTVTRVVSGVTIHPLPLT